jgi:hypothetical protein
LNISLSPPELLMNARRGTILLLALSLLVSGSLVAQTRKENIDLLVLNTL